MNDVFLNLGIIQIKWYSVFILLAILSAYFVVYRESKRKNVPIEEMNNLIFYLILIGILGARIYYVIFNLDYYLSNPGEIIKIWNGGLAIHGGIIASIIFLIIYCKKKKLNIFLLSDIIVVGVILAQAIGRWGNFFNGEAYGRVVSIDFLQNLHLPNFIINGMYIDGFYREPTFLYESVFSVIGFIILIIIRKNINIKTGWLTGIYFIWYGVERLVIEVFRTDSLMLYNFKVAQIISIMGIIFGIYLLFSRKKLYKTDKITK